jgi:hypothetical protein
MHFPFGSLTEFLATYGALLASVGLGWNLYRDLLDRAKLEVSVDVRRFARGEDGTVFVVKPDLPVEGATEQLYVVMSVVNVGRRPVVWKGWGGKYFKPVDVGHGRGKKSGFTIVGRALPKMLREAESHSEFTELTSDLRPASENVKSLFMWDSSGKFWKVSRRQLKELKRDARRFSEGRNDQD